MMPIRGLLTILTGLLFVTALGGCAASQNPLGPESEAISEPRLVGTWQHTGEGGGWDYLHVFAQDEGRMLEIVAISSEERAWAVLSAHVSAAGERRYVSLRLADAAPPVLADVQKDLLNGSHPYSFVAIRFDGDDRLLVAYPVDPLHAAVKAGTLAGETSGDYDVYISDSSAKIAATLGAVADAELFKEPLVYRRVSAAKAP